MTSTSPLQQSFSELLEIAYQIGSYIRSYDKPTSETEHFHIGPNYFHNQMQTGLALEFNYNVPVSVHTPCGNWQIISSGSSTDWREHLENIKNILGLTLLKRGNDDSFSTWAITKWREIKLEHPVYKERSEFIPYEKVKEIWKSFSSQHFDLLQDSSF